MAKKILIGVVTSDTKKYCFDKIVEAMKSQTFHDFDVVFVDNSESDYGKFIEEKGFKVIKDSPKDTRINNIISGRNIIREEFLKGGYEYLFFLDSDVIIPADTIEKLLSWKQNLITGVYLVAKHIKGKPYALPCLFKHLGNGMNQQFSLKEVQKEGLVEIDSAGLGCCLIHRNVLKDITFRNIGESKTGGEDFAFFIDAKEKGFQAYADMSIKCFHMHYPENDPRHNFHKFETHMRKSPKTEVEYSNSLNIEGFELE